MASAIWVGFFKTNEGTLQSNFHWLPGVFENFHTHVPPSPFRLQFAIPKSRVFSTTLKLILKEVVNTRKFRQLVYIENVNQIIFICWISPLTPPIKRIQWEIPGAQIGADSHKILAYFSVKWFPAWVATLPGSHRDANVQFMTAPRNFAY